MFPIGNIGLAGAKGGHILARVPDPGELERRTTQLLQRLIQFDTVNPPGADRRVR